MKGSKFYIINTVTNERKEEVFEDFNEAIDAFVEMFNIKNVKLSIEHNPNVDNKFKVVYDLGFNDWKIVQRIGE